MKFFTFFELLKKNVFPKMDLEMQYIYIEITVECWSSSQTTIAQCLLNV